MRASLLRVGLFPLGRFHSQAVPSSYRALWTLHTHRAKLLSFPTRVQRRQSEPVAACRDGLEGAISALPPVGRSKYPNISCHALAFFHPDAGHAQPLEPEVLAGSDGA
jgi:hypothetical protein